MSMILDTTSATPSPSAAEGPFIDVANPATGERIARVPAVTPADVGGIAARARSAQPHWQALDFAGRAKVLRRAQRWVVDNSDRIVRTIVAENGKAYEDAHLTEASYAAQALGFWAARAPEYLADERVRTGTPFLVGRKLRTRYAPVGVVAVIGPWNYPLTNGFGDCIPALAAGNAVVLKPASLTPLTSLLMAECLAESGLPDGVFQVAVGSGDVGAELIDHVDCVMFTGSTAVGRKVMERAAKTLTPVGLELGGKDPMIVLADADLERAANAAVYYSMQNGGQTCISVERVYVERPVYRDFTARVERKVRELRQGVPGRPGTVDVGAVTSPAQIEVIGSHVRDALEKGARVPVGGHRAGGAGDFFEPTLILDADHTMRCMTEETFGPTLPVMSVGDPGEAVALANDSRYGLQASIWTRDTARGERLARQLEAGVVTVNDAVVNYAALGLPMGGWKESGLGTRHGADGIRKFTRKQALLVTRVAPKRDLHMFPYRARTTWLLRGFVRVLYGRGGRGARRPVRRPTPEGEERTSSFLGYWGVGL
jgi:acyl-CoA reductase-like NAD-dependent aldehyde dehydrogenase